MTLLLKLLSLEVVGVMVTLLSFVMTPLGPIQMIVTELSSTPLTVLTVQSIIASSPTVSSSLLGSILTMKLGTVQGANKYYNSVIENIKIIPVTSSVILPLAITDGLALITTSHSITLPSSVVFSCEIL